MNTSINLRSCLLMLGVLLFLGTKVNGQIRRPSTLSKGFDFSFSAANTLLTSDIGQLSNLRVTTEGANVGFFYGSNRIISNVTVGFHYSTSDVRQTVDKFSASKTFNYYINANAQQTRVRPYLSAGIAYDLFKFAGFYLDTEKRNFSVTNEPYIGKISQVSISGGLGFEYVIPSGVRIYADAKYASSLTSQTKKYQFSSTRVGDQVVVSVGVRVGLFAR